ncbi:hypothetical protein FQN51_006122 [Onygenales sp. PD_10]|nr:hypothetical protein FQN51_006122 [Onygenales sp. PD_10]
MGAGGSKPSTTAGAGSRHVFSSETPVQFSPGFVESLQASAETDSSRAQTLELHIQNRVAAELERIRARETQTLADLEKRLTPAPSSSSSSTTAAQKQQTPTDKKSSQQQPQPSLSLDAPRVPFAGPGSAAELAAAAPTTDNANAEPAGGVVVARSELSSAHVQSEISALKAKLAERKKVVEMDEGVEKAREEVVRCLRGNEKRPLDCWREVEGFKREVGRLERGWVEKVVG